MYIDRIVCTVLNMYFVCEKTEAILNVYSTIKRLLFSLQFLYEQFVFVSVIFLRTPVVQMITVRV